MNSISWEEFALIGLGCALTILVFRTAPLFLLRGKELPVGSLRLSPLFRLQLFAALIANDILSPTMFDAGIWPGLIPLIAAAVVIPIALKTKSLVWSIIVGVGCYGLLLLI